MVGLGYVGLPLAVEFARRQRCRRTGLPLERRVIGFDVNDKRLAELQRFYDSTNETSSLELSEASALEFTCESSCLQEADVFIVTVPTPIDNAKRPDLSPLVKASITVGRALKARAKNRSATNPVVVYESTVFPGATEEVCVPILERESGLIFNKDFFCGYSPERINPGDQNHRLTSIIKVTSGSTPEIASWVDDFYGSIIDAGTHQAGSLKIAEAAKVIENTQRDLNIALVNELSIIFSEMNIDTLDVLEAAGTKWNFMPFRPGLVGGHCIGVDPYYLTHKAEQLGYHPQVVLAGRRINDGMGRWVVERLVLELARRSSVTSGAQVLILGLSFKENCPDLRNTRVIDVVATLRRYNLDPVVVDPWIDKQTALHELGLNVLETVPLDLAPCAVVVAVAHREFLDWSFEQWERLSESSALILDLKGIVPRNLNPLRL